MISIIKLSEQITKMLMVLAAGWAFFLTFIIITDVIGLVHYVLNAWAGGANLPDGTLPGFTSIVNADVNGDGAINIMDISTIVNFIMEGTWATSAGGSGTGNATSGDVDHRARLQEISPNITMSNLQKWVNDTLSQGYVCLLYTSPRPRDRG